MKKKLLAAVLAAAMVASTGCVVMAADGDTDYDVENREYKDVTITLHTRWLSLIHISEPTRPY